MLGDPVAVQIVDAERNRAADRYVILPSGLIGSKESDLGFRIVL
jgi:hypothetical protein